MVYLAFILLFVGELALASTHFDNIAALQWWQLLLLGFAAFRGGVCLAEDKVFEWLREPFCVTAKDATGAGDSVSPRFETGWKEALGNCLSCPICCLTHVGSALLTITALWPQFGILLIYGLAIAGVGEMLHSGREFLFWNGCKAREECK